MFEPSGKPNEVTIIQNQKHCLFCKTLIQGEPDTWRALYRNEKVLAYAHKKCMEGKQF